MLLNPQETTALKPALSEHGISAQQDLIGLFLLRYDRQSTRRSYANDIKSFFGSEVVTLEMCLPVTFQHVNGHLRGLQEDGKAPATIRRRTASLRGFFSWLVALRVLNHNPADRHLVRRAPAVRMRDRAITVLTSRQARELVDAVDLESPAGTRDRALLITLLYCVLRRSEASAMDFEHLRQVGEYWVLDLPSTKGGANQSVKAPPPVVEAIAQVREAFDNSQGPIWQSVSNNSKGDRLSARSIYRVVHKYALQSGISQTVGAHTLRHTGCTLAIESGAAVQQVQEHARHKNLETTMIYVHQRNKLADSAADYIDF